jgi:hypothetical protein
MRLTAIVCAFACSTTMALAEPAQHKETFAVRHPKIHKAVRKGRKFCQLSLPVVQFAGACAQVVTAVR